MPGWTKHENYRSEKTTRAFDLQMMKTSKAKDVTRTLKQDRTRLDEQLRSVSRDHKKRMNQLQNETNKLRKKAAELREIKDAEDIIDRPSSQMLSRRRGSLDSSLLLATQREFMRRRSKTMISVTDLPAAASPFTQRRISSGTPVNSRRASLDPTVLTQKQKEFFAKIAKLSTSQNDVSKDESDSGSESNDSDSPPASPPPLPRSRQGRRGSLPTMHLGFTGSRPATARASQLPPLEERRGSQNTDAWEEKENEILERIATENTERKNAELSGKETEDKKSKIFTKSKKRIGSSPQRLLNRRSSLSGKLNVKSKLDSSAERSTTSPNQEKDMEVVTLSKVHSKTRPRSNSLIDPGSVRLSRRRNSIPNVEGAAVEEADGGDKEKSVEGASTGDDVGPGDLSLAEQFDLLRSCRYLRSRGSIYDDQDCDLSNVFG